MISRKGATFTAIGGDQGVQSLVSDGLPAAMKALCGAVELTTQDARPRQKNAPRKNR